MLAPSGDQFEISGGGYRAVVTESGAALRELSYAGRPLVDGFGLEEHSWGGRGQLLAPWPNRLAEGRFSFGGHELVLPLTEPELRNASHGLVRWAAWTLEEHTAHSVSLTYRLMARPGWPWTLDLHVVHDLSADGLTVTVTATNMSPEEAPYAAGSHPYLCVGAGPVDQLELTLPAATALRTDELKRPVGSEQVEGGELDFRISRPLRSTVLDTAFTDLERDEWGRATTTLRDPRSGEGVSLWVDPAWTHLQVYTADDAGPSARRSLAVEPMTAPPDALRSGTDLVVLAPAGSPGDEHSGSWGVRAVD
ncbi:aldose 1-epimerase family protein [Nocardioides sp. 31GB23]|uniref:Aldose 1-epimerase n=1 Tax=Nocardioides salarius TaxID=374513 RepID=A0ABS2M5H9_9ACTN|nr:aldose 1-epimerase family protein [Nocardioides salarius]MBM7506420.1 aldose 1-epimerase [Nocardioides salarius]